MTQGNIYAPMLVDTIQYFDGVGNSIFQNHKMIKKYLSYVAYFNFILWMSVSSLFCVWKTQVIKD